MTRSSPPTWPPTRCQDPDHDDPRFSSGLLADVAATLTRHGYPPVRPDADAVHWQLALLRAIYQDKP